MNIYIKFFQKYKSFIAIIFIIGTFLITMINLFMTIFLYRITLEEKQDVYCFTFQNEGISAFNAEPLDKQKIHKLVSLSLDSYVRGLFSYHRNDSERNALNSRNVIEQTHISLQEQVANFLKEAVDISKIFQYKGIKIIDKKTIASNIMQFFVEEKIFYTNQTARKRYEVILTYATHSMYPFIVVTNIDIRGHEKWKM